MKDSKRYTIAGFLVVLFCIIAISCKFSFADDKKPKPGSIQFGASKKPDIQISPEFESFRNVFSKVASSSIPTVVSITSTIIDTVVQADPYSQFYGYGPFDEFFQNPRRRPQEQKPEKSEERRTAGFGSGVIVSRDGYVLTNYHVVGKADEILVTTSDDREFEALIVGSDSLSDVAVIKLKGDIRDLPVAYLGDSDKLKPGDWVMAVGNPFNLSSTVTTGIVSAVGRHTGGIAMYQNFIQTDAAINPGNSGGALVNIDGELVGINTMIFTRSGGYMGIGFAIPVNMAKKIMEQILYKGKVERGWLGVQIGDIDQSMKDALGLKTSKGVLVNEVFKGQPADKAGIKAGDVVISIDGIRTPDANSLRNTVASIEPGKKVALDIIRDGQEKSMQVVLSLRNEKEIEKLNDSENSENEGTLDDKAESGFKVAEKVGFKVGDITPDIRERLKLQANIKGAVVLELAESSLAARKGIKNNDIIHTVKTMNSEAVSVTNAKDFIRAISNAGKDTSVMLGVLRENRSFFVAFKIK